MATSHPFRRLRSFSREERGIAAVEFAILLPFMLTVYLGMTQMVQAMIVSRKLSVISRSLADLVAQQPRGTNLSASQVSDIFTAANTIMTPYTTSSLRMTVTGIDFVQTSPGATTYNATTRWSVSQNGGVLRACGTLTSATNATTSTTSSVPAGIYGSGSVIAADVTYAFTPSFGGNLLSWTSTPGSLRMARTMYMRPRSQSSVVYSGTGGVICP